MKNIDILEKHFKRRMVNKNFETFKRTHPTLLKVILNAMDEVSNVESIKDKIDKIKFV